MEIPSASWKSAIQKVWMLAAQIVGLEDDQSLAFKSSSLPICVSFFSVSRSCELKRKYLSGKTVKDVEMGKVRFVLPSSSIWDIAVFPCFELLYNPENCSQLMIIQMILAHRNAK